MLKKLNYRIIILAGGHTRCERMVKELQERDIIAFFVKHCKMHLLYQKVVL